MRADISRVPASRLGEATGLSKYGSISAYFEERANGKAKEHNDFALQLMARGTHREPAIIDLFRRLLAPHGWRTLGQVGFFRGAGTWRNFGATPDGFVISPKGHSFTLEVKSRSNLDSTTEGPPLQYSMQMLAQMVCCKCNGAFYFSVTDDGGWRLYFLKRSPAVEKFATEIVRPKVQEFVSACVGLSDPPKKRQMDRKEGVRRAMRLFKSNYILVGSSDAPVFEDLGEHLMLLQETEKEAEKGEDDDVAFLMPLL